LPLPRAAPSRSTALQAAHQGVGPLSIYRRPPVDTRRLLPRRLHLTSSSNMRSDTPAAVGTWHDPDLGRPIAAPLEWCAELLGVDWPPSASWPPTSSRTSARTAQDLEPNSARAATAARGVRPAAGRLPRPSTRPARRSLGAEGACPWSVFGARDRLRRFAASRGRGWREPRAGVRAILPRRRRTDDGPGVGDDRAHRRAAGHRPPGRLDQAFLAVDYLVWAVFAVEYMVKLFRLSNRHHRPDGAVRPGVGPV